LLFCRYCHMCIFLWPPPRAVSGKRLCVCGYSIVTAIRLSVRCPSVNTCFTWCNISVLSGGISMKLGRNICHFSGRCWKYFQGQRPKTKVILRPNAFCGRRTHFVWWCCVEADLFISEQTGGNIVRTFVTN